MKRRELLRHLAAHGCQLLREGGRHSLFFNPKSELPPAFLDIQKSMISLGEKSAATWEFRSLTNFSGKSRPL
jgi:hypothetical protein